MVAPSLPTAVDCIVSTSMLGDDNSSPCDDGDVQDLIIVVIDQGVTGVTCGGRNSGCHGNGHEVETLPLKVLHGTAHVLFHAFHHLMLHCGEVEV